MQHATAQVWRKDVARLLLWSLGLGNRPLPIVLNSAVPELRCGWGFALTLIAWHSFNMHLYVHRCYCIFSLLRHGSYSWVSNLHPWVWQHVTLSVKLSQQVHFPWVKTQQGARAFFSTQDKTVPGWSKVHRPHFGRNTWDNGLWIIDPACTAN